MRPLYLALSLTLTTPALFAADLERAKEIVENKCHHCHGRDGEGSSAIYPRLAAQHEEYIAKQLADFKSGRRKGTMNEMAADLNEGEMIALGQYFAAKPARSHRVRDQELAAVGSYIYHKGNKFSDVPACESCHGSEGQGTTQLPRLAGQHKRYLADQLHNFGNRTRTNDNAIMHSVASRLTDLEIEAVSLYVSGMESTYCWDLSSVEIASALSSLSLHSPTEA